MPAPWLPEPGSRAGAARAQFPHLPALSGLLAAGAPTPESPDWRAGIFAHLAGTATAIAPVAVAASGLAGLAGNAPLCLAAPVHMVAGISRVHLPPGGRLVLEPLEEQAWCAAFNQEFGSGSVKLHIGAPGGGWLLQAPFAPGARDAGPDALAGEALARKPAADENERLLRRLGTEVEMWLAAHEMNREREARHVPVLNAIWFWDGGTAQAVPPVPAVTHVASNVPGDAWLAGLARHAGTRVAQAAGWRDLDPAVAAEADADPTCVIVLAAGQGLAEEGFWESAEENWFVPLAARLPAAAGPPWLVQLGPRGWLVPDRSLRRWFRPRRRSWWQMAGQVRP